MTVKTKMGLPFEVVPTKNKKLRALDAILAKL
jgi:hypothetical protein